MLSVLLIKKVGSLFIIILMGIILMKTKIGKIEDSETLSSLSLFLIFPCAILSSFQTELTKEMRNGLLLAFLAAILIHIGLIIFSQTVGKIFKMDAVEKASIVYSNSGNLIIPLVGFLLGSEWVIYTSAFISVQTILVWVHGQPMICGFKKIHFRKIITNPNIWAIILGILMLVLRIQLPGIIKNAISDVGAMLGPAAMLVIGIVIGKMGLKKIFSYKRMPLVLIARLMAVPLLILLFIKVSGIAHLTDKGTYILLISLLAAIGPSASTVTQLSQIYGKDAEYACAINITTTMFSIITMPIIVMIYQSTVM